MRQHLTAAGWTYELYVTTGEEGIADVVRAALARTETRSPRIDLFVAAGGDGTVSGVAGGVAQTNVPMGIVPLGTGNTLARELDIPLATESALDLLTGDHCLAEIDAIEVTVVPGATRVVVPLHRSDDVSG